MILKSLKAITLLLSGIMLLSLPLMSQNNGNIEGVIRDKAKNQPLSGANVQILGTEFGAAADEDGYYIIRNIPSGSYEIEVTFVGFDVSKQTISIRAGKTIQGNFTLNARPLSMNQILVSAVRDRAESPVSSNTITEEEINESRHANAYDAFRGTPGVHVMQGHSTGFGLASRAAGRILIRGLGRSSGGDLTVRGIQILVDGVPDFSQTHGHPFPDVHALDNIERIEVVKGPSSVRHGNAMSGAIIMTTKKPTEGLGYMLKSSGGSFGTTENIGRLGYGGQQGFIQASGNLRHTDGHRDGPDKLTAYNGSVKAGFQLSPNFSIDANGMIGHFDWENPGPGGQAGGETDWRIGDVNLNYDFNRNQASVKLWGVDGDVLFANGLDEPVTSYGAKAKVDLRYAKGSEVTLGFDWMNYDIARNEVSQGQVNEIAPYAIASHRFSEKFRGEAGVRFTDNEQFGTVLSPEVGILIRPVAETALRARAAHGFRTPNAFETTFSGNANPDLEAANMWQYEVGINQAFGPRITIDVTGFIQAGDNMIRSEPDPNAPSGSRLANTGKFNHRGIETAISVVANDNLAFNASTTNLDLEDDTALAPHHVYTIGLAFTPGELTFAADGRMITDLYNQDGKMDKLNDFFVLDLQTSYRINNLVRLLIAAENVLDRQYEIVKGFPMPGFGIYGGFSLQR